MKHLWKILAVAAVLVAVLSLATAEAVIDWSHVEGDLVSAGNTKMEYGTEIQPAYLGKVLRAKNQVGGWYKFTAPERGYLRFTVDASTITRPTFNILMYRIVDGSQVMDVSQSLSRDGGVQTFMTNVIEAGETIYWWDSDATGRGYTLIDPYLIVLEFVPESEGQTIAIPGELFNMPAAEIPAKEISLIAELRGCTSADQIPYTVSEFPIQPSIDLRPRDALTSMNLEPVFQEINDTDVHFIDWVFDPEEGRFVDYVIGGLAMPTLEHFDYGEDGYSNAAGVFVSGDGTVFSFEYVSVENTYVINLLDAGNKQHLILRFDADTGVCTDVDNGTDTPLAHEHNWTEATCTMPKTCTGCGVTEGSALGHSWGAATCTEPKTCTRCGATEGSALGHSWRGATCTEPKTCTRCGVTEGSALGHSWRDATCTEPMTCSRCGATEGSALGHSWRDATCTEPMTCSRCGATKGSALGHSWAEATYTSPKTCTRCGMTEGVPLRRSWNGILGFKGYTSMEELNALADTIVRDSDRTNYSREKITQTVGELPDSSFAFDYDMFQHAFECVRDGVLADDRIDLEAFFPGEWAYNYSHTASGEWVVYTGSIRDILQTSGGFSRDQKGSLIMWKEHVVVDMYFGDYSEADVRLLPLKSIDWAEGPVSVDSDVYICFDVLIGKEWGYGGPRPRIFVVFEDGDHLDVEYGTDGRINEYDLEGGVLGFKWLTRKDTAVWHASAILQDPVRGNYSREKIPQTLSDFPDSVFGFDYDAFRHACECVRDSILADDQVDLEAFFPGVWSFSYAHTGSGEWKVYSGSIRDIMKKAGAFSHDQEGSLIMWTEHIIIDMYFGDATNIGVRLYPLKNGDLNAGFNTTEKDACLQFDILIGDYWGYGGPRPRLWIHFGDGRQLHAQYGTDGKLVEYEAK